MQKATAAEVEKRVTAIYQLLMRRETYQNIVRYATGEWGCSSRQVDTYISRAKESVVKESEIARQNHFDEHLCLRRNLFRNAYNDKNWRLCLEILKDESSLLGMYPVKTDVMEAIHKLNDAKIIPPEIVREIAFGMTQFEELTTRAFKNKLRN